MLFLELPHETANGQFHAEWAVGVWLPLDSRAEKRLSFLELVSGKCKFTIVLL